jgi:hypothetical protein
MVKQEMILLIHDSGLTSCSVIPASYNRTPRIMNKKFISGIALFIFVLVSRAYAQAQTKIDSLLPIRGFVIAAPTSANLDSFISFIHQELATRTVNTLILRVDYNYQYKKHPELRADPSLSEGDVKKIVTACRQHGIRLIPQINLLGHQSWAGQLEKLLEVYPQFDETPHVKMPEKYVWPNPDGLYCKSYCPLHPDVHKLVFELVDELCDAFETDAFHAGMDEVFYIGDDKCPRCSGRDKAELFGGEVSLLHDHLLQKGRELWIWGDRLLDGKTTGLGMWEASFNNTYRAIDMIPKDVVICDWHYDRPDKTAVYFAMKGFRVITCPWRNPEVAVEQLKDMLEFRKHSTPRMKNNFYGMMHTVWSGTSNFLNEFYRKNSKASGLTNTSPADSFRSMYEELSKFLLNANK